MNLNTQTHILFYFVTDNLFRVSHQLADMCSVLIRIQDMYLSFELKTCNIF